MTPFVSICADPAWKYTDRLRMGETRRSAEDVYRTTMTTDQICALATRTAATERELRTAPLFIAGHPVAADAFLWLWVTNPFLLNGAGFRVCRAWGFEPKQLITWVKGEVTKRRGGDGDLVATLALHFGMGHMTRGCTEHMILATRGKTASLVLSHSERNLVVAPAARHSEKPEAIYRLIERVTPGPYLELFARTRRDGWTSWGDELPREVAA